MTEEIKIETNIRNLDQFSKFIHIAAINHTQQIIFSNIGNDAEIKAKTVRDYFDVLIDTLIADLVPVYQKTNSRKPMIAAKLYFFYQGVVNALVGRKEIVSGTPEFGNAFEHFIWKELNTYKSYNLKEIAISYWRTTSKIEVDFIIHEKNNNQKPLLAIEVKSKEVISKKDSSGLLAFKEEYNNVPLYVISFEKIKRKTEDNIVIINYNEFLIMLWGHQLF